MADPEGDSRGGHGGGSQQFSGDGAGRGAASPRRHGPRAGHRAGGRERFRQLACPGGTALRSIDEIIDNDEDYTVEFKSTARWDLREGHPSKAMDDAVVNWLTTHLINALGHTPVTRTRARIAVRDGREICRLDVANAPQPVRAKISKAADVLFVRLNNSTRALPEAEHAAYITDHWRDRSQ